MRRIADEIGLPNAKKKDSTGICFIGERPFREFLNRYIQQGARARSRTSAGRVIGQHLGLSFYTLGQRQGLGIGGVKAKGAQRGGGEHAPWFVARKDMENNTLWVVQGHDHPLAAVAGAGRRRRELGGRRARRRRARYAAKTRYRQADAPCTLRRRRTARSTWISREPQWAVTPGQSAVLYDGEVCLGGGVIAAAGPADWASTLQNSPSKSAGEQP